MRGQIYNREYAKQEKDYSNLRYGKITGTDVDGLYEFGNRCFVIIELKFGGAQLPFGQKLALDRLTDSINKPALFIVASHKNGSGDIMVDQAEVTTYRFKGIEYTGGMTVKNLMDKFVKRFVK